MATIDLDNVDEVIRTLSKLENKTFTEILREARKKMRATMRKEVKGAKQDTPVGESGDLKRNIKVRSRTKRGRSTVKVNWDQFYSGFVNFKKKQLGERFATDFYLARKDRLENLGRRDITEAFTKVMTDLGFKVKADGI